MEIKDIIRVRRIELNLTMKELGDKIGVSGATISRWESGLISSMKQDKIAMLCKVLKLNPTSFIQQLPAEYTVAPKPKTVPIVSQQPGTQTLLEKLFADEPEILNEVQNINIDGNLKDNDGAYTLTPEGEMLVKLAIKNAIKEGKAKREKVIEKSVKGGNLFELPKQ